MARGSHSFKKSTVRKWMISYLVATLIPLFLVCIGAFVVLSMSSSFITYSNNITASFVQSSFHDVLSRINEIKAEIVVDTDFDKVRDMNDISEVSSLDLFYSSSDIRRLEQSSSKVKELFLYSPAKDWYISNQSWGGTNEMAKSLSLSSDNAESESILREEIWDVRLYDLS